MAIQTFLWVPFYGTNAVFNPRIRSVPLGDGYDFRAKDGINNFPLKYNLVFSKARQSEIIDVLTFLQARGGIDAFLWTPPPPYDTNGIYTGSDARPAYSFICKSWNHVLEESNADSSTFTFDQDFNPVGTDTAAVLALPPPTFTNDFTGLALTSRNYSDSDNISVRAHASAGKRIVFTTNGDEVTPSSPVWPNYPSATGPGTGPDDFLGYILGTSGFSGTFRARQASGSNWDVLGQEARLTLTHV
jgi:phage-related protein